MIVFVVVDEATGQPCPVSRWAPDNEHDRRPAEHALQAMALGKGIEETIGRLSDPAVPDCPSDMARPPGGGLGALRP